MKKQHKRQASEASRKIFHNRTTILLLQNRFSGVFLWFSDFFEEFRGGHVPPGSPHAKSQCMSKPWVQTIFFERFCYRMSSFCFFDSFYIVISHYRFFFQIDRVARYPGTNVIFVSSCRMKIDASIRAPFYEHDRHSVSWIISVQFREIMVHIQVCSMDRSDQHRLHFVCIFSVFYFFQICRFQLTSDKHKFEKKEHYILL